MRFTAVTFAVLLAGRPLTAQLARQIDDAPDGKVRITYELREGVCGSGRNIYNMSPDADWEPYCDPGPGRLLLTKRNGEVVRLRLYVGGRWRESARLSADLGEQDPQDVSDYLLELAADAGSRVGEDAIFPATVARGVTTWPQLLELARDRDLREDTREQAVFWLGQEAAEEATRGLVEIVGSEDDLSVKRQAVFALSQLDDDRGIPFLIEIVRDNPSPELRRTALFWLAESEDPRAVELFEEILTERQ